MLPLVTARVVARDVEVPTVEEIHALANRARTNGLVLRGNGPFRRVAGCTVPVIVGPLGCTCRLATIGGEFCQHRAMLAVELGLVPPPEHPAAAAAPRRPRKERPDLRRPPMPPRPQTPMDRLRARNRASWLKAA